MIKDPEKRRAYNTKWQRDNRLRILARPGYIEKKNECNRIFRLKKKTFKKVCELCELQFNGTETSRFCSRTCAIKVNQRVSYKPFKINNGYVLILKHGHPNADVRGYVPQHRLVMAEYLGRPRKS